ncbi:hypothetical protein CTI12_AA301690 [Artemisia annua]|uniref:Uncharacterized protein n=1 Tax=Artemisia annua TaxID=35608 RepID=A0A2U1N7G4_ARTAN|nr:hypothetical protein CTI12_AA301690 [Artemisia annua]
MNNDGKKFVFDTDLTLEDLKALGEGFYSNTHTPFYPIPEDNDGDVKIVVGNNFDDTWIVLQQDGTGHLSNVDLHRGFCIDLSATCLR